MRQILAVSSMDVENQMKSKRNGFVNSLNPYLKGSVYEQDGSFGKNNPKDLKKAPGQK